MPGLDGGGTGGALSRVAGPFLPAFLRLGREVPAAVRVGGADAGCRDAIDPWECADQGRCRGRGLCHGSQFHAGVLEGVWHESRRLCTDGAAPGVGGSRGFQPRARECACSVATGGRASYVEPIRGGLVFVAPVGVRVWTVVRSWRKSHSTARSVRRELRRPTGTRTCGSSARRAASRWRLTVWAPPIRFATRGPGAHGEWSLAWP